MREVERQIQRNTGMNEQERNLFIEGKKLYCMVVKFQQR